MMEKQGKELYLRLFSANICDLFEDLLDKHDMTIPSEDREGEEDEARIYGDVYYDLEARVTELLAGLCEEVKAAPDIAINIEDYNGFEGGSNNKGTYASWKEYSLSKHECDNLVEVMVANIRGMGIDEGSGYFGLKSFGLNEDRFNLYCEVSKEQEDGDISFVVYYALEFDEGDNLWSEWAHTETLDIDELKSIIFDIASADCTKDVQTYFENLPKVKVDNKNGFEDENTQSDKTTVNKKALSYAEQAELFIKENPAVAWEISMLIDRENHREDIIGKLEEHGLSDIPDEDIENLVDEFQRALSKNDGYYEAFWSSADYVIDEYCMSKNSKDYIPEDRIMENQYENLSDNGKKLYKIFKKEFLDNGDLYNGCIPMNSTIATAPCFSAIDELVGANIIQLRNCDGFAYELTETERKMIFSAKNKTIDNVVQNAKERYENTEKHRKGQLGLSDEKRHTANEIEME